MATTEFLLSLTLGQVSAIILSSILLLWYVHFSWKRRDMYFHASKVHGPTSLPFIGCAYIFWGKDTNGIMEALLKNFEIYPNLSKLWFGSELVYLMTKPEYIEKVMTSPKSLHKPKFYKVLRKAIGNGLMSAPTEQWKVHRKQIAPTFNQRVLDNFVVIFTKHSVVMTELLEKTNGEKNFDLFITISKCTLDIICETAMGVEINVQTTDCDFVANFDRMAEMAASGAFSLYFYNDFILNLTPTGRELKKRLVTFHDFTSKVIEEKKKLYQKKISDKRYVTASIQDNTKSNMAFLDWILEYSNFSDEELRDEVEIFILGGIDTTALTLACLFIMLGMHQDVQQKVYEEALDFLGPDRDVLCSDLKEFKYMEMVIKETMRLFPAGALFLRGVEEDLDLGDAILPKGSAVMFYPLAVQRNPIYWPDPLKFDPDRFLPENVAKRHPCSFIAFSYGPRGCIGSRYAMMSMKTILATTIRRVRIFTDYKSVEEIKLKANIVLRLRDGAKVWVEKR